MERRTFIASSAGLLGAGASSRLRAAETPRRLVRSYLTAFRPEAHQVLNGLKRGARLNLARAEHRRFDPSSVAVLSADGRMIGYLPGVHSRILSPLLEHGLLLYGTALAIKDHPRPMLHLDVVLEG